MVKHILFFLTILMSSYSFAEAVKVECGYVGVDVVIEFNNDMNHFSTVKIFNGGNETFKVYVIKEFSYDAQKKVVTAVGFNPNASVTTFWGAEEHEKVLVQIFEDQAIINQNGMAKEMSCHWL